MARNAGKAAAPPAGKGWRSRIVGHAEVDATELKAHPDNWRIHPEPQKNALRAIIGDIGWVQDVLVSKRSGRILDGHARVELAVEAGEKVPVTYIDVSEDEERKILATFDSSGGLAIPDDLALADLVAGLEFGNPDLDSFLRQLVDESAAMAPAELEAVEAGSSSGPSKKRNLGEAAAQIKPVLYADQVHFLEEAIRLTGVANRGAALIEVCKSYINGVIAA